MKTMNEIIQYLEWELRYNSSPAIPYIKIGTSDLRVLLDVAKKDATTSNEWMEPLERELRYNSSPAIAYLKVRTSEAEALLASAIRQSVFIEEDRTPTNKQSPEALLDELLHMLGD